LRISAYDMTWPFPPFRRSLSGDRQWGGLHVHAEIQRRSGKVDCLYADA